MDKGSYVVIRTQNAGVHCGILKSQDGSNATLNDARRIWYWKGAFTLSAIANNGVGTGSKISEAVSEIDLTEVIEVIACTTKAQENLEKFKAHEHD